MSIFKGRIKLGLKENSVVGGQTPTTAADYLRQFKEHKQWLQISENKISIQHH